MKLIVAGCFAAALPLTAHAAPGVEYRIGKGVHTGDIAIQAASIVGAAGMRPHALRRVNAALRAMPAALAAEARACGAAAQGHPWGYTATFEKAVLSGAYLSVVFAKSTVCAGSPDFEKEVRVFSVADGKLVRPAVLVKTLSPASVLRPRRWRRELVSLEDATVEGMLDDTRAASGVHDDRCDFFLKNTVYRVWAEGLYLVLYPEFQQALSTCQREYVIRVAQ